MQTESLLLTSSKSTKYSLSDDKQAETTPWLIPNRFVIYAYYVLICNYPLFNLWQRISRGMLNNVVLRYT